MTRKSKPPIAIYSALADATRCRIVEILLAGPIPVHTLADAFSISRPAISRHLRVLKTAGLVAEVKKGRENLYALRTKKLGPAIAWIETVLTHTASGAAAAATDIPEVAPMAAEASKSVPHSTPVAPPQIEPAPIAVTPPAELAPTPAKAKPKKAERVTQPEPAVNQMGFDF